jgi:hypothetical protein
LKRMKLFTTLAASAVAQLNIGSLDDLFSQLNAGLPAADTEAAADEGPVEGIGERYFVGGDAPPITDAPPTTAPPSTDEIYGSGCWKCDEMNFVGCAVNGYFQDCAADQAAGDAGVCFIEFRESHQGLTQLCTGCKDAQACADIKKQNFAYSNPLSPRNECKSDWRFQRPTRRQYGVQQSTCRQCFSMCEPNGATVQDGAFCFGGLGVNDDGNGSDQTKANWFKPPTTNFGSEFGGGSYWSPVGDETMAGGQLGIPLHTAIGSDIGDDADKLAAQDNHVMFSGEGLTAATGATGKTAAALKPLYWALHDNQHDFWTADLVTLQRDYRDNGWLANGDPLDAPADQFAAFTDGVDTNLIL